SIAVITSVTGTALPFIVLMLIIVLIAAYVVDHPRILRTASQMRITLDCIPEEVAASDRAIMMEDVLAMPWSGQYFTGMPLELEAKPAPGYRFSHWSMKGLDATQARNPKLTLTPDEDVKIRAVMAPDH